MKAASAVETLRSSHQGRGGDRQLRCSAGAGDLTSTLAAFTGAGR